MKNIIYLSLIALVTFSACEKEVNEVPDGYIINAPEVLSGDYQSDKSFKIVAYYAEGREPDSIALEKYKMITHLHYAFAYPNADGTIRALAQPTRFTKVMERAKEAGVKTAISFSGSEDIFSAVCADSVLREKFIENIVTFVLRNNLDGVDIDWEFPRANKSNDITFDAFMSKLSVRLHQYNKYLSAAVTAALYAGNVKDGISSKALEGADFVNLMAYDGANWAGDPNHSSYKMAQDVLNAWLVEKGLPKEKAVLGFPAYGKNSSNSAMTFRDLVASGANPNQNIFTVPGGSTYYYNGIELVKQKATLAKAEANGLMVWEFYQDMNGNNSLIKAANDALGRSY